MKRSQNFLMLMWCALSAGAAFAGMAGVPTNLNANGSTSATSVDPPGWLEIFGTSAANTLGDSVHSHRYFIEVTSTTLDVRVFDPGTSGERDFAGNNDVTTTYALYNAAGTQITSTSISNDSNNTQNRLVRFTSNGFFTLNSNNGNNVSFSGLTPGLHEFRVTTDNGDEGNFYGVDFRVSKASTAHYNVYTLGTNTSPTSSFFAGESQSTGNGTGVASPITQPIIIYPYITSGCTFDTTNFDGDSTTSATIRDVTAAQTITSLTLSGNGVHTEQTVTIESTAAQNIYVDNYGVWDLRFDPGTSNAIDWRVADFSGWADNPTNSARGPTKGFRMYLPNGYAPTAGNPNATAPTKPALRIGASVVSGPNPPTVGNTTVMVFTASLKNSSAAALTSPQISVGLPTGVTFVTGSQACFLNGTSTTCTDGSAAGYRRASTTSLAAGSTLSLRFQVNVVPTATGLMNITGAPATGTPPPNTTAWAQYTSNWSTTEYLGPLCQMVVNVGGTTTLPTPSRLAGLALEGDTLHFATSYQQGTQGFVVYEGETPTAPLAARRRLSEKLVASTTPDSLGLEVLSAELKTPLWPWLFVDEIDSRGRQTTIGQASVRELRDPTAALRLHQLSERFMALNRPQVVERVQDSGKGRYTRPTGLKLLFSRSGQASVSRDALEAAGLPQGLTAVTLSSQGAAVPFTWSPGNDALQFEARAADTQYTGTNVYLLEWHARATPPMVVPLTQRAPAAATGVHRVEKNAIYFPRAKLGEDPWFWALVRTGATWPAATDLSPGQFDLPLGAGLAGSVPLHISVLGRSGHRQHVEFTLNGTALPALEFDGTDPATLHTTVPAALLRATGNQLTAALTSTPLSPDDVGLGFVYLDKVEFEGLGQAPTPVVNADAIVPYQPTVNTMSGVDYLVITHPDFIDSARDFVAMKNAAGFHATVIDVSRLYDRYAAGLVEAQAIRRFIADVAAQGSLKYVLLWGDDSFDPRNFTGLNARSFIPSLDGYDHEFGRVPSENLYADVNFDNLPDVAIGRIPVQTQQQSSDLLNKLGRNGLTPQSPVQVAIADAVGANDDDFLSRASRVQPLTPRSPVSVINAGQSVTAGRSALAQQLSAGVGALHYFGHGSPVAWSSQGSLWGVGDSTTVQNQSGQAVVFSWSCFSEWYQYLYGPSLMESLILAPNSGVSAAVGPSGITLPAQQSVLREPLYQYYFVQKLPLGEAVRRAKADAVRQSTDALDVVTGWNLLGDPSMQNDVGRLLSTPKSLNELQLDLTQSKKAVRATAP